MRKRRDSPPDDDSNQASWWLCWRRETRATVSSRSSSRQDVASSWRPGSAVCKPRPATLGHQPATETSWITLASCKRQDWPRETTTSGRSLGKSATIYPHRSNEGDGGGSDAYDDLGSNLVELRDVMLLLAMFRLYRSTYVVLDTVVVVAQSIQWNQAEQIADKIENRGNHLRMFEAKKWLYS